MDIDHAWYDSDLGRATFERWAAHPSRMAAEMVLMREARAVLRAYGGDATYTEGLYMLAEAAVIIEAVRHEWPTIPRMAAMYLAHMAVEIECSVGDDLPWPL